MPLKPFGSCCKDMDDARTKVPESFFRVADNGVFYLVVGTQMTEDGPAYFDHAVLFCPFCGVALQTRDEIARAPKL
jgi:hypothetical protein